MNFIGCRTQLLVDTVVYIVAQNTPKKAQKYLV